MRRSDRAQDLEFSLALMDRCTHGVVAFRTGDTPYCIPLSLARRDRSLYFHCARQGRKTEPLRADPRVCVTFVGEDSPAFLSPASYTTYFQSVVATGTAHEVTEEAEKIEGLRLICEKMLPDHMGEPFERAISRSLGATAVWRIDLEDIQGKAKLH